MRSANRSRWREITGRQWTVFVVATVGYGLYYVCRLSLSVVKTPLVAEGVLTETQVGIVGAVLFYLYAVGKFANGFLADRVSLRRLFSLGLLVSAGVNLLLGWGVGFATFLTLWAVNGWVQSMGAPACVVSLTRWFDRRQRGTFYGLWSSSHNIGEGLTFLLTAAVVAAWDWRAGFMSVGLAGLGGAAMIWLLMRDRPAEGQVTGQSGRVSAEQWRVLRNPVVWSIALASTCMYVTRYAVNSWGVFYFQNAKQYTLVDAGGLVAISSVCGVLGTVASGWVSDVLFKGDRFRPALLFGLLNLASLALMLGTSPGHRLLDTLAMVGFGLGIGALVCYLGGLMAVDAVSSNVAGAALGVVGIASYLGAGVQDILSGWLIGRGRTGSAGAADYDFTAVGSCWLAAALGAVLLILIAERLHRRQAGHH
jgi:OPA family sugar phosphate sensor protein UhpC-like MFS transporter